MEVKSDQKLVFVYNADSGIYNAILDSAHKILSPDTYACKLCDITYNAFSENKVWREFRESASYRMIFLHKDEFQVQYAEEAAVSFSFPVVLKEVRENLEVLISSDELNLLESAEELIALIRAKA